MVNIGQSLTRVLKDIQSDLSSQPESSSESKGDSSKPTISLIHNNDCYYMSIHDQILNFILN
jgi:hypothetical protein